MVATWAGYHAVGIEHHLLELGVDESVVALLGPGEPDDELYALSKLLAPGIVFSSEARRAEPDSGALAFRLATEHVVREALESGIGVEVAVRRVASALYDGPEIFALQTRLESLAATLVVPGTRSRPSPLAE
jgi:hypothetical protein